ncbi:MAG: hypothetical protein KZQ66_17335, partial [Candidatus Thiodiazotropha sp. (ex Lucinoma aequizonata)]|nr:hypothetical protein [Candidatus Thiodiazotropha sp. (ex Lucinoma aequizonata)]MCU7898012.1 hypothetical protein [Candidatus Thiodiazotropha sp. (ex Lucinoma aequizonata)]MCU7903528.1 hypothetical protein [Candidatus Thiodiazotropha sp. (ex Lucinoma aequizonata)]
MFCNRGGCTLFFCSGYCIDFLKNRSWITILDGSLIDSNLVTIQPILPWPIRLGLMHLHEIRFFALKKQC